MNQQQQAFASQRDAERLFAASVSVWPDDAIQQCGWLQPEDILDERISKFWGMVRGHVSTDEDSLAATYGYAMEAGIHLDLMLWQQELGIGVRPSTYAKEIARRKYLSNVSMTIGKLATAINSQDDTQVEAVISEMASLGIRGGTSVPSVYQVAERFAMVVEHGQRAVFTYIPPMDKLLGGLERQTLTILAARPSMGKTALMLQIARNQSSDGRKVIFFSAEMSAVSLWARMACPEAGVNWVDIRSGSITDNQKARLIRESKKFADMYGDRLILIDAPQTTQTVWQTVAEHRPDVVMFDHLRLFRDQADSEVKRLGKASQQCKEIAKAFDCSFLLASQLSRSLESRLDKRPILSDLRDSGEIEENADVVLMLYRDSYYHPPEHEVTNDYTEIWIRKFRDGVSNSRIDLMFDTQKQWFEGKNR